MEKNIKVYAALAEARKLISKNTIVKSGKTAPIKLKNGGVAPARNYLSLKDISGAVVEACAASNLTYTFNLTNEKVNLTVISTEDGSVLEFEVPANLQGSEVNMGNGGASMHPIQRLGSNITYLRRYMLCTAFEIVENDNIEGTEGIPVDDTPQLTPEQEAERLAEEEAKKQADLINKARAHFHTKATKYIETHPAFNMDQVAQMCGMKKGLTYEEINNAITTLDSFAGATATTTVNDQVEEQQESEPIENGYTKPKF